MLESNIGETVKDWVVALTPDQIVIGLTIGVVALFTALLVVDMRGWKRGLEHGKRLGSSSLYGIAEPPEKDAELIALKKENEELREMIRGPAVLKADPEKAKTLKGNIFADVYHLDSAEQSIGIRCECGWHGKSNELVRTYGRTRCPYCGKEFKEVQ